MDKKRSKLDSVFVRAFIGGVFLVVAVLPLVLKRYFYEPFRVPTEVMRTALHAGDYILINKHIYGKMDPQRGDVLVFASPDKPKKYHLIRLIGLPGETIEIQKGNILINGKLLIEPSVIADNHYYNGGPYARVNQTVKIPAGSYYALFDSSGKSRDSRFWGFLPVEKIVGKAEMIYYPFARYGLIE